jgi:hypothetical protein
LRTGNASDRKHSPVFVMGCHRSGTNLLYDMLMSAGGFALYRGLLPVFETLIPRFGSLKNGRHRKKLLATWLHSKAFRRTGLDREPVAQRILNECRSGGDFICAVMGLVAQNQGVSRWAVYDPDSVLHVEEIKETIPDALLVHIIRDGRDIALSLKKMAGFSPLPWDRSEQRSLLATGLYWEWMVRRGRSAGRKFPSDYLEVHYEDLILRPQETLTKLGVFLQHDLDYRRIRNAALGSLSESNSSFREENGQERIQPLGRWKERLSPGDVAAIEAAVGECLEETGYALSAPKQKRSLWNWFQRAEYRTYLSTKLWMKMNTPAGRLASLSALELESEPAAVTQSAGCE